ncbi:MAG: hypothetical protein K2O18_03140 [Oscillospiraceae bacterium]|nr:hypothetical protein [Oscillospiraceae bacterium]
MADIISEQLMPTVPVSSSGGGIYTKLYIISPGRPASAAPEIFVTKKEKAEESPSQVIFPLSLQTDQG